MTSVNLTILDVGHGNSTLIHSNDEVVLIDAAIGASVQDILSEKNIDEIDNVIISHTDSDHIGGTIALLLDASINIKEVHLNTDALKSTRVWEDFLTALTVARYEQGTKVIAAINKDTSNFNYKEFELEVLAPSPIDCLTGPGSSSVEGVKLDANTMSVVLRLIQEGEKIALITGDMDARSLEFLKKEVSCLKAKVLIFPHHGGLPKYGSPKEFSKELCDLVLPDLVVFSNARNMHNNPRKEIIKGINDSACSAVLACTQISKECCEEESKLSSEHLIATFPSAGKKNKHSCAGTINIALNGSDTDVSSSLQEHQEYILQFSDRKCLAKH